MVGQCLKWSLVDFCHSRKEVKTTNRINQAKATRKAQLTCKRSKWMIIIHTHIKQRRKIDLVISIWNGGCLEKNRQVYLKLEYKWISWVNRDVPIKTFLLALCSLRRKRQTRKENVFKDIWILDNRRWCVGWRQKCIQRIYDTRW